MTQIKFLLAAVFAAIAAAHEPVADPESRGVDPPPGSLDYVERFAADRWTFGKLLWSGSEPCGAERCEAAFNGKPLFLLVQREPNCCGERGYSVMIVGRAKNCASVSYYLVYSDSLQRLTVAERLRLVQRHTAGIAATLSKECGIAANAVPLSPLAKLKPWLKDRQSATGSSNTPPASLPQAQQISAFTGKCLAASRVTSQPTCSGFAE